MSQDISSFEKRMRDNFNYYGLGDFKLNLLLYKDIDGDCLSIHLDQNITARDLQADPDALIKRISLPMENSPADSSLKQRIKELLEEKKRT